MWNFHVALNLRALAVCSVTQANPSGENPFYFQGFFNGYSDVPISVKKRKENFNYYNNESIISSSSTVKGEIPKESSPASPHHPQHLTMEGTRVSE